MGLVATFIGAFVGGADAFLTSRFPVALFFVGATTLAGAFLVAVAVVFAEILSRSIGYGVSQLGVTINGQSSSIMSVLVLGAGTDYALLLVARYREELHHTADKYKAMSTALGALKE